MNNLYLLVVCNPNVHYFPSAEKSEDREQGKKQQQAYNNTCRADIFTRWTNFRAALNYHVHNNNYTITTTQKMKVSDKIKSYLQ